MSWTEVNKEMEKIEQIVLSIESEEDKMEKAEKRIISRKPEIALDPTLLGARPKDPKIQNIEETKTANPSGLSSRIASSR
jgi:hypothetical protein